MEHMQERPSQWGKKKIQEDVEPSKIYEKFSQIAVMVTWQKM